MKRILSPVFVLLSYSSLIAQKDDSIVITNSVLHYSIHGEGSPILFLSGGPGISSNQLFELSERLSKNYKCILFDQRGTGRSHTDPMDSTTINLNQSIKDINLLLERENIKQITIIGHSWGAMLAISYAIKYPGYVAKLVLIGPGPLALSEYGIVEDNIMSRATKEERIFMKQAEDSIANHHASKELLRAYSRTFFRFFLFDASKLDSVVEIIKKSTQNNAMQELMLQDLTRINYNVKPGVSNFKMPFLVICGRQDPVGIYSTFALKELNKNAKIAWIEKCGHFPWLEQASPFYLELLKFLK